MSDRILRTGLIDSETIASLHDKTYRFWTHLIVGADDYGLIPTNYGFIKSIAPLQDWTREMVAKMLSELTDAELIFPYEVGGKPFAALNKFKAYVLSLQPKYPQPPFGMGHCLKPFGYKNKETRISAKKILNIINDETEDRGNPGVPLGVNQSSPGTPLGHEVRSEKGEVRSENTPSKENIQLTPINVNNSDTACATPDSKKMARAGRIVILLRNLNVKTASVREEVQRWAEDQVPDTVIQEAVTIAKQHKGAEQFSSAYLAPIVFDLLNPKPAKKHEPPWWSSEKTIEAKAREIGCWPARKNESWNELKTRISEKLRENKQ